MEKTLNLGRNRENFTKKRKIIEKIFCLKSVSFTRFIERDEL